MTKETHEIARARQLSTILVSGYFSGDDQERKLAYFERLDHALQKRGYRLYLVNFAPKRLSTPCAHCALPHFVPYSYFLGGFGVVPREGLPSGIDEAVELEAIGRGTTAPQAARKLYFFRRVMRDIVRRERPVLALMWHQFNSLHLALADLYDHMNIPYRFAEYGLLPGTIGFDECGQMAESRIVTDAEAFATLPVSEEDSGKVARYLDCVRSERRTRKPQRSRPEIVESLRALRDAGTPIIFYAGENGPRSGLYPEDSDRARRHSPYLGTTEKALRYLVEIAGKRGWHVVFKPHPMTPAPDVLAYDRKVFTLAEDTDIFELFSMSDVVATLLSQASYLALLHGLPCVLMGRNPLSGKGCVYELESKDGLESLVDRALAEGFTVAQQEAWNDHTARLCTHYLYALDTDVEEMLGRGPDAVADHLAQAVAESAQWNPQHRDRAPIAAKLLYSLLLAGAPVARLAADMAPGGLKKRVTKGGNWF